MPVNPSLVTAVAVQLLCQLFKVAHRSIKERRLRADAFVSAGGMPSAHTAFVVSLTLSIGLNRGFILVGGFLGKPVATEDLQMDHLYADGQKPHAEQNTENASSKADRVSPDPFHLMTTICREDGIFKPICVLAIFARRSGDLSRASSTCSFSRTTASCSCSPAAREISYPTRVH